MPIAKNLFAKYDMPGPRYTSYPTVPFWEETGFSEAAWIHRLARAFEATNASKGISLYVHLPYCERLCTFCGCTRQISRNHAVEAPYISRLLEEWAVHQARFAARPRIRELHLGGGTPTFFSPDNLARLVDGLLSGAELTPDAQLGFEAHPNSTTPEHLKRLGELGFTRLSLGVQDLDPEVQRAINRFHAFEQIAAVTRAARDYGYDSVNFDLIHGLPRQRPASVKRTFDEILELSPERIAFYGYAHVPWRKGVAQRGFDESEIPRGAAKRQLYELGRQMLTASGYLEIGLDHFALPGDPLHRAARQGTLHRNFMGYTPVATRVTIGLGMSAISDSGDAFAQNEKTVKAWASRVSEGRLPLARGHLLDAEDRIVGRHIHDLMCRFETRWPPGPVLPTVLDDARARLADPEADGLVRVDETGVRVTRKGRPFLRNVCMAFDARFWRSRPQAQLFSRAI
jgi:oxygen-independent coproporphyrinogen-3 oxidase